MALNDGAGNDTDVMGFGQGAVFVEVELPLAAEGRKVRIFWDPIGEVVFRKDSQLGTLRCSGFYKLGGLGVVGFDLHRLRSIRRS